MYEPRKLERHLHALLLVDGVCVCLHVCMHILVFVSVFAHLCVCMRPLKVFTLDHFTDTNTIVATPTPTDTNSNLFILEPIK